MKRLLRHYPGDSWPPSSHERLRELAASWPTGRGAFVKTNGPKICLLDSTFHVAGNVRDAARHPLEEVVVGSDAA